MRNDISAKFNDISQEYDRQRRQFIPCYDDFYNLGVSAIELKTDQPRVLDIGAGTGLFSAFLFRKFPKAKITLIDISEKMLDIAKQRFKESDSFEYIVGDYCHWEFANNYDVIISALSIHHLTDEQKKDFYNKCYSILKPNGIFVNCDQVLGNTEYSNTVFKKLWKSSIEKSGLSKKDIEAGYERIKLDKETPLFTQLQWLSEAGFSDVDCIYKYYHFSVMFGRKSE